MNNLFKNRHGTRHSKKGVENSAEQYYLYNFKQLSVDNSKTKGCADVVLLYCIQFIIHDFPILPYLCPIRCTLLDTLCIYCMVESTRREMKGIFIYTLLVPAPTMTVYAIYMYMVFSGGA